MFLVLTQDQTGWQVVALTATATAKQAAEENAGGRDVAVLEWTPEFYESETVVSVKKLTEKQAEARMEPVEGLR